MFDLHLKLRHHVAFAGQGQFFDVGVGGAVLHPQFRQPVVPMDLQAGPLLELLFQQVFQDALLQYQHKGKLARQLRELDFGAPGGALVKRECLDSMAELDGVAGDSHLVQQLQGAGVQEHA